MAVHKKLSASNSDRWIHCSRSVQEIAKLPYEERSGSSWYADEGTAAHAVLKHCLTPILTRLDPIDPHTLVGGYVSHETEEVIDKDQTAWFADPAAEFTYENGGWFAITEDMAEAVLTGTTAAMEIVERLGGLQAVDLELEHTWDLSWLHPDVGGTSDLKVSAFLDELVVMDYKHGKGVVVEVDEYELHLPGGIVIRANTQLLIYVLGAAKVDLFSHDKYTAVVCQPRAPHGDGPVRTATYTRKEIMAFLAFVTERANLTGSEEAKLAAGKWCRWCAKNGNCEEQDRSTAEHAGACFDDLPPAGGLEVPTDPVLIAKKLLWVDTIDVWCKAVKTYAQRLRESGTEIPDHKLVQGKTNRKLRVGQDELVEAIGKAGLATDKLFNEPKLKSPRQIEQLGKPYKALIGKKDAETGELLYTYKPPGKIALVHSSDPRAEVLPDDIAQFTNLDEEETGWDE